MARFDLTDFEWSVIEPVLPNKPRGVPRVDDLTEVRPTTGAAPTTCSVLSPTVRF
jgi:transposase